LRQCSHPDFDTPDQRSETEPSQACQNCIGGDEKGAVIRAERTLSSRDALWLIFFDIVRDAKSPGLVCAIDGLDECDDDSVSWLVDRITSFVDTAETDTRAAPKFFITSRKIIGLERLLKIDLNTLKYQPFNDCITIFIGARLNDLERVPGFKENLRLKVQGCVIEESKKKRTPTDILRCLDILPKGLPPLYHRLLHQIDDNDRPGCAHILRWVAQVMKPLTLLELAEAVDIQGSQDIPP
jgi:hypothetical protein